jgi:TetR/AcrR family transcriptional repressor of mexJK operon
MLSMPFSGPEGHPVQENSQEDRIARILAASFDVFSEYSFQDATTAEIARRAQVSKRDLYAHFPDKHSLLIAVVSNLLKAEEASIAESIARAQVLASLREKLEVVGLTLVAQALSTPMSVIVRHVTSESIDRPLIGIVYFENGPARRSTLISKFLSKHVANSKKPGGDSDRAGEDYLALIAHRPLMASLIGLQDEWDTVSMQLHVKRAVDCFLRAHPWFG